MENKNYRKVKRELQLIEEPRQSTRKKKQKIIKDEKVEDTEDEQCCIEEIAYVNVSDNVTEEINYTKLKEAMKTHIDQCTSMHRELLKEIKFLRAELKVYKKNTPYPEIRTINNTLTILDIPKCTEEEFEEFDNNLNIEEYEQALTTIFRTVTDSVLGKYVRGCLRMVMSDAVATKYSWFGNNGNKAVGSFVLMKVIRSCTMEKFPTARNDDITFVIKKWFQYAKDRERKKFRSE